MQKRRQRLDLPFVKRRSDPVTWIYDHRAGVFSLVALALVMAILFIGSRIVVRAPRVDDAILIDLRTVEELQREVEMRERENRLLQSEVDIDDIRNAVSNEGAELRDDRGTNTAQMREAIDRTNESMRGNRDAWDEGLREIEAMKGERDGEDEKNTADSSRASSTVQVSFSLVDPLRHDVDLKNPGYQSENGGRVVVNITVNRNGDVVAAAVDKGVSTNDSRMHETAVSAARRSRFNIDQAAPERHTGTITYIFIPQ